MPTFARVVDEKRAEELVRERAAKEAAEKEECRKAKAQQVDLILERNATGDITEEQANSELQALNDEYSSDDEQALSDEEGQLVAGQESFIAREVVKVDKHAIAIAL